MNTTAEPVLYPDGAAVRVRTGYPAHHFRTPAYIQGHTSTVDALCGVFPEVTSFWIR